MKTYAIFEVKYLTNTISRRLYLYTLRYIDMIYLKSIYNPGKGKTDVK